MLKCMPSCAVSYFTTLSNLFIILFAFAEAAVNESCFFNEQCEAKYFQTECRDGRCVCRFEMTPFWLKDGTVECKGIYHYILFFYSFAS